MASQGIFFMIGVPSRSITPRARALALALEARCTWAFWSVTQADTEDADDRPMGGVCDWSRADREWDGMDTHPLLWESVSCAKSSEEAVVENLRTQNEKRQDDWAILRKVEAGELSESDSVVASKARRARKESARCREVQARRLGRAYEIKAKTGVNPLQDSRAKQDILSAYFRELDGHSKLSKRDICSKILRRSKSLLRMVQRRAPESRTPRFEPKPKSGSWRW